jgi:hypothetical protein
MEINEHGRVKLKLYFPLMGDKSKSSSILYYAYFGIVNNISVICITQLQLFSSVPSSLPRFTQSRLRCVWTLVRWSTFNWDIHSARKVMWFCVYGLLRTITAIACVSVSIFTCTYLYIANSFHKNMRSCFVYELVYIYLIAKYTTGER